MEARSPFPTLEVLDPEGQLYQTLELKEDRLTIGRLAVYNDLALEVDPQLLISRKGHCALERDAGGWWVVDNGSVNGTFLQHDGAMQMVLGRASLAHQDCILLLGLLSQTSAPRYWTLRFTDLGETRDGQQAPRLAVLEYDWIEARLFHVEGRRRQEIGDLRPQEHKLIRYMDQRNRANGQVPVLCSYDELLAAIWGEEPLHTEDEISHLIYELRQKLEPNPRAPQFLQTVKGLGYRLVTRPLSQ